MKLRDYLKEMIEKVDNKEEEGGAIGIYLSDDVKFMYHDDCFADMQEDFCILYDKVTEVNMVIPYDKIMMFQYMNDEMMRKQIEDMDFKSILKKLRENE